MRIGIDITPIQNGHKIRGVGQYAINLLTALTEFDRENEYILFGYGGDLPEMLFKPGRFKVVTSGHVNEGKWRRLRWHQFTLPKLLHTYNIDLIHILVQSFDVNIPVWRPARTVITIHDIKARLFPAIYLTDIYKKMSYNLMLSLSSKANHVITDSQNSKEDLLNHVGIPGDNISVIPLAADPAYELSAGDGGREEGTAASKFGFDEGYLLFVGAVEPSKNIDTLLEAYEQLLLRGHPLRMVIVGVKDPNYLAVLRSKHEQLMREVIFLESVGKADLRTLYREALVFVYPSIYEGFGLPVLEAMKCGTPVVTSNVSSLPEVAGDAALLTDPFNKIELANNISALLEDEKLRSHMIARGLERAGCFSWRRCAEQTVDVYHKVMGAVN